MMLINYCNPILMPLNDSSRLYKHCLNCSNPILIPLNDKLITKVSIEVNLTNLI